MKHSNYIILLSIIFIQAVSQVSAQTPIPIKVACIGNSITYGDKVSNRNINAYPEKLEVLLNTYYTGKNFDVVNYGVSGTTMLKDPYDKDPVKDEDQWSYWEFKDGSKDGGGRVQYDLALSNAPDIVIIKFGTNDARLENWRSAEGYGKNNFYNHYTEFINSFRAVNPNVIIYICFNTPSFRDQTIGQMNRIREDVIPIIKQIARKNRVHLIDLHSEFYNGKNEGLMDNDDVHPNATGAELIAKEVFKMIKMTYKP